MLLMVVQVADVDDDDADEQFERDARDQHRQYELVEAVSLSADVQQQLELGDLRQRQDRHQSRLRLRLRLLQLDVTSQQLTDAHRYTYNTSCFMLHAPYYSNRYSHC